jgi:phosphoribosylamine--glycine ligase
LPGVEPGIAARRVRLAGVKVLVVGSGGREHALAWRLAADEAVDEVHAAPGNPGIATIATCHPVRAEDAEGLLSLCIERGIDLVVIGPEAPLVAGVGDALRHGGVSVFGPSAGAARIEGSKRFAKDVMRAAAVPTAAELPEPRAPCVVKADGLAAGKGVFVCRTQAEADDAWRRAEALGTGVLAEELLEGEEVSLFALTDGTRAVPLSAARDAKRLLDGDEGPNTGGMGAYSPVPGLAPDDVDELAARIHEPVLHELARLDTPFVGLLYAGLILTEDGPRVLEFNCRFGDPETQAVLPVLDGPFAEPLARAAAGDLGDTAFPEPERAAVTVVLASAGYPESPEPGEAIAGIEDAESGDALVFHAGTALRDGSLVAAGGRVLGVTGVGASASEARDRAYAAVESIRFPGAHYRRDIAEGAVHVAT